MSEGLMAVQARVSQLQSMLGLSPSATSTAGTSSTDFADVLTDALSGGTGTTASSSSLGNQAVALATSYTGVPYLWGGTNPEKGLDCSGLVQLVYRKLGVTLPRVAADQAKSGTKVASLDQAQPGDLVFFGSPAHHVGIYVGDGKMIDAPHKGATVGVHKVYETPSSIRRIGSTTAAGTVGAAGLTGAMGSSALLSAAGLSSLSGLSATTTSSGGLTSPYAALFTSAGARYGVDPALLSAVAKTESGYDADAVSSAGARGLMQLMPGTARSLGADPDDPTSAVNGAAKLMASLLKQFDGRVDLALAGYNAGPGAVRKYGGVPPYSETQNYVKKVTKAWEALR